MNEIKDELNVIKEGANRGANYDQMIRLDVMSKDVINRFLRLFEKVEKDTVNSVLSEIKGGSVDKKRSLLVILAQEDNTLSDLIIKDKKYSLQELLSYSPSALNNLTCIYKNNLEEVVKKTWGDIDKAIRHKGCTIDLLEGMSEWDDTQSARLKNLLKKGKTDGKLFNYIIKNKLSTHELLSLNDEHYEKLKQKFKSKKSSKASPRKKLDSVVSLLKEIKTLNLQNILQLDNKAYNRLYILSTFSNKAFLNKVDLIDLVTNEEKWDIFKKSINNKSQRQFILAHNVPIQLMLNDVEYFNSLQEIFNYAEIYNWTLDK